MKKLLLSSVFVVGASVANAAVLDFEANNSGDKLSAFTAGGVTGTITAIGGSNDAMVFDSIIPTGRDTDLGAPFYAEFTGSSHRNGTPVAGTATLNPGNILIISEDGDSSDPDDNGRGGKIVFSFDTLVNFLGFDVLDDVSKFSVTADTGDTTGPINLGYDNQFKSFTGLNWMNVSTLTFDFGRASGAIDNIAFEAVAPVPVPASLPLLAAGLGAFVYMRRKSKG